MLALLGTLAGIQANIDVAEWISSKMEYNKKYTELEDLQQDNKRTLEAHNKRGEAGEESFERGINQFTDISKDQLDELMESDILEMRQEEEQRSIDEINERDEDEGEEDFKADEAVDWRKLGAVTPVQSQGNLPTSWAFAVAGAVESSKFLTTGKLAELSEQNLIDCCKFKGKDRIGEALSCIKSMGGIDTQQSYPYQGAKNACKFNKDAIGAKVKGIEEWQEISEVTLAKMVSKGPVAAYISEDVIHFYDRSKGIFKYMCRMVTHMRYAVLVVGYGTDPLDGDYWLLRTSQGTDWGEDGYIRLARNKRNYCMLDDKAYRPIIEA